MKLIKSDNSYSDPFSSLERLFGDTFFGLDRSPLFDRFADREPINSFPVNIYEDKDNYYATAELPGINKKDVKIELENAVLTISGERKVKKGDSKSSYAFSRSITVGDDIDSGKVNAKLLDGVLTVTLPRHEERKPRSITVS
jgi:HSP20 family protein